MTKSGVHSPSAHTHRGEDGPAFPVKGWWVRSDDDRFDFGALRRSGWPSSREKVSADLRELVEDDYPAASRLQIQLANGQCVVVRRRPERPTAGYERQRMNNNPAGEGV